jgi:hypothetical protein
MKKYAVKILPRAEEDIERNARWWAEHHSFGQAVSKEDEHATIFRTADHVRMVLCGVR